MKIFTISIFVLFFSVLGFLIFQGIKTTEEIREEMVLLQTTTEESSIVIPETQFNIANCRIQSDLTIETNGFYPGDSPIRKTSSCDDDEIVISGGCEIIGQSGMYRDFGGVQNVGYMASYPNKNENGWTCGFYGGFGADMDKDGKIPLLRETGTWDINSHAICCPVN